MGVMKHTGDEIYHTHYRPWAIHPAARKEPSDGSPDNLSALDGLRVLVVDDNADMRYLLKVIFEQFGANVTTAASAAEALEMIKQLKPDVLISDIGMPDEDGYTLIRRIRALEKLGGDHLPAVALTAHTRREDYQRALASGFEMHVPKPIEPTSFARTVASLVQRH